MKIKEEEIPTLIREGKDREVIALLYKKVFPLVKKSILKNKGRAEDASDVFQDALMLFYRQVVKREFNEQYKVYGYLFRVSINRWINKIKKDKIIALRGDFIEQESEVAVSPYEFLYTENNENLLKELFGNIGEKCIELLTYTIYFNLLFEDIVLRMGFSSVDAVKMQQHRCKQKLIKEVERNPGLLKRLRGV